MDFLQDSISFLFLLFIYIPLNAMSMMLTAFMLGMLNKVFKLNFPIWAVSIAAGVLVFTMLYSMLETASWNKSGNTTLFYATTVVINIAVIILMLTLSGIGRLVFRKKSQENFSFQKPQRLATILYCCSIFCLAIIPIISQGKAYLVDVSTERYKENIKQIIEKNNITEFKASIEKNANLAELRLSNYTTQSLIEYLLAENKVEMVQLLIKHDKNLLTYHFDWTISSPEMLQVLINEGMPAVDAIEKLTYKNKDELVKLVVEKYHPLFDNGNNMMVSYITRNVLDNNDTIMLNYLVRNGLAKGLIQSNEAIYDYIKKNDFETVKMLVNKGFQIDTAQHAMIETAITNENIEMLDLLFKHKFSINKSFTEYTYVEDAIVRNSEKVIDLLLSFKPDVTTLHPTFHDGETNALLLAEKYERVETFEKLKKYTNLK